MTPPPTFYVDSVSGLDTNDGLTEATAWQTLAKVSATAVSPGSRVLFAAGDYRGKLLVPGSGTAANRITYQALDPLNPPTFWGSDILPSSGWTVSGIGADCYELVTATLNWVLADHVFLESAEDTAAVAATPDSWFWSGGTLYVHAPADPNSSGVEYSACRREDVIHSNSKNDVRIRGFVIRETAKADAGYGIRVEGSLRVTVEDVEVIAAGKHAIGVISASATVRRATGGYMAPGQGFGGATTFVHYASSGAFETLWEDCESDTGNDSGYPAFTTHGEGVSVVQITRMVANGYGLALLTENPLSRVTASDCAFTNGAHNIDGTGTLIERCSFAGENTVVFMRGDGCIIDGATAGEDIEPSWQGGRPGFIVDEGPGTIVRNCVVALNRSNGGCIAARSGCDGSTWTGNTFRNAGGPVVRSILEVIPNLASDGNAFDVAPTFTTGDQTIILTKAQWQAFGYDVNSTFGV